MAKIWSELRKCNQSREKIIFIYLDLTHWILIKLAQYWSIYVHILFQFWSFLSIFTSFYPNPSMLHPSIFRPTLINSGQTFIKIYTVLFTFIKIDQILVARILLTFINIDKVRSTLVKFKSILNCAAQWSWDNVSTHLEKNCFLLIEFE